MYQTFKAFPNSSLKKNKNQMNKIKLLWNKFSFTFQTKTIEKFLKYVPNEVGKK